MSGRYIVVFKSTTSPEVIDKQAEQVNKNGGKVYNKLHSSIIKSLSAEIPDSYFQEFQSNLASEIDYIEPDSTVTTQAR